ncbi:fasciclin-domain-containing protein [Rhizophagus clarus]|uniref:Fasciclin-domain-containing protein n=1 Tax=Rhizophagus clarus TaxID=94130 RepID=A0A8H3QUY6_9GLOM|nr:fasciclin-domain-containing protein [Rhizophagus clarus]
MVTKPVTPTLWQTVTIARYIQTVNDLSTLRQILSYPGLIDLFTLLDSPVAGTLFAPTNEAFLSSGIDLTNANGAFVSNLIRYHSIPNRKILSEDLMPSLVVSTSLNDSSLVNLPNGGQVLYLMKSIQGDITINNGNSNGNSNLPVKIIQKDIICTNGVIHIIDSVILPPLSLIDTANNLGLTQFVNTFTNANLLSNFNTSIGITIFAPSNDAFNRPNYLSKGSVDNQISLLKLHVIIGTVIYEIKDGVEVESSDTGYNLHFTVNNDTLYVNNGKVERSDILLQNGVMYVIDNVLSPLDGSGGDAVSNNPNNGFDSGYNVQGIRDKKLIVGTVLGGICGGIVISLFSCMLYKWYRAQKNSKYVISSNVNNNINNKG